MRWRWFSLLAFVSLPVWSVTCDQVVSETLKAQKSAASLFNPHDEIFIVVQCGQQPASIFAIFYAQMHSQKQHSGRVPTASLVQLKHPVNPKTAARSTGFMAKDLSDKNRYVLKMRTRFGEQASLDTSKTVDLKVGEYQLFESYGITFGILKLTTSE